jgi:hypothetical protein
MITLAPALVLTSPHSRSLPNNDTDPSNHANETKFALDNVNMTPNSTPRNLASGWATPTRKLTIDTDLANVHMNLTELGVWKDDEDLTVNDKLDERKGSVGGLRGGVGLEMKDWLARSNPSVSLFVCLFCPEIVFPRSARERTGRNANLDSPNGTSSQSPVASPIGTTKPVDLESYLSSPPPGPLVESTRHNEKREVYSPVISAPIKKVKKRGSGWNLRSGAGQAGAAPTASGSGSGLAGFVNRLRSRSHHNLRAEAGGKAEIVPPLPTTRGKGYVSRSVPLAANFDRDLGGGHRHAGLQPGPSGSRSVSPGLVYPASPYREDHYVDISLGRPVSSSDDLTIMNTFGERSRSGSAAPSALTYASASSSSEWSSRFPTPSATPALTDVRVEVDPFDLTSPVTEMFNFSEMGFLGRDQVVGGGAASSSSGAKEYGRNGTVKAGRRLGSARSLKDLKSVASGFFGGGHGGGDDYPARASPVPGPSAQTEKKGLEPSATLRNKRSVPRFGPGVADKSIQKRTSLSWLRDTLGRRHERDTERASGSPGGPRPNDLKEVVDEDRVSVDIHATPVQSLMVPTQRNKARPALTITLPSSASISGTREAITISLSDDRGEVLGQGKSTSQQSLPPKPSTSGSFSDLYAELGISPPGESDEEEMPYSPRVERPVDFFSFGDIMDSLGGTGPIEMGSALNKKSSVYVSKGSASRGTSMVGSGRTTSRSSWRSSRHSIKPASAPPTAALPPLPTLAHLQTPDKNANETSAPLSPRPVDLSSGRSSAIELGFSAFQHIRSWDEIKEVDPGSRPESNGTDATLAIGADGLDKALDYAFLDDYHGSEDESELHDAQMSEGDSCRTMTASSSGQRACASGSQTQGVSASTSSEQAGTASGYSDAQLLPRGRATEESGRQSGPNRSRSGSRSPPRAPRRAGSPVSEEAIESSSEEDSDSDDDEVQGSGISDDDVPLAQRIPGALQAQKSLRRENRRSRRASKYPGLGITSTPKRSRQLDGRDNPSWQGEGGVPARDLDNKLQQLLERQPFPSSPIEPSETLQSRSTSVRVPRPPAPSHQNSLRNIGQVAAGFSSVSRQASIKQPSSRMTSNRSVDASPVLGGSPFGSSSRIVSRSNTPALVSSTGNIRLVSGSSQSRPPQDEVEASRQEWLVSRSESLRHPRASASQPDPQIIPSAGQSSRSISRKPSLAVNHDDTNPIRRPNAGLPPPHPLPSSGNVPLPVVQTAGPRQRQISGDRGTPLALNTQPTTARQIIYLESTQGSRKTIDLSVNTTADEVLQQITGGIPSESFMGDWVLFEVFGEFFNMERPIRGFESLVMIMKGWGKDSAKNAFVAKISPLDRLTKTEVSLPFLLTILACRTAS